MNAANRKEFDELHNAIKTMSSQLAELSKQQNVSHVKFADE